jgi:hypothetical protein
MLFVVALVASYCVLISSPSATASLAVGGVGIALLLSTRAYCALFQPFVDRHRSAQAGDPPGHARARRRGHVWLRISALTDGLLPRPFEVRRREHSLLPVAVPARIVR